METMDTITDQVLVKLSIIRARSMKLLTVNSNGQIASNTCQVYVGGNTSGNVTVYSNTTPTSGTPTAGVFLSQVPYTGLKGGWNVALFVFGLFFWSAVIAWFILRKKDIKGKFSRSDMIAKFKQNNLAEKMSGISN